MAKRRPKAIFVGVPQVADALANLRKDWDFLPSVPDVASVWEGLNDGSISNDVQAILILDQFFDPSGADTSFEQFIVAMSPYCFFGIVNYTPEYTESIRERVEYEAYNMGSSGNPLYFYIDPKSPGTSLDVSVREFALKASTDASEAVIALTGRETSRPSDLGPPAPSRAPSGEDLLGPKDNESEYLGQIVAVTSSKGGSGKSTVSMTLASYIAHASEAAALKGIEPRPLKVIVVDLDVRDGQVGFLTDFTKPTVIALRMEGISDQTIRDTVIHSPKLKLDLLLAPKRPRNSEDTPPDFYIDLLQHLRRQYDYIILDTSVNYLDPLLEKVAYPAADQIVFVTDIVINSIFSMTRWIQEVTKPQEQSGMGIPASKIGVVVNKALADVSMTSDMIEKSSLGLPIISVIPSNPKLVAHSANLRSLELLLKHPEIRGSIRRLARAIVGNKYKMSDEF